MGNQGIGNFFNLNLFTLSFVVDLGELGHYVQALIHDYETKIRNLGSELNDMLSVSEVEKIQWSRNL